MTPNWTAFDADANVLTCTYSLGPVTSNALAVRGAEGLIVVSPPFKAQPRVFDTLQSYGTVRALVASNAFHHMGIPEWKARFPDAAVFAPAQSMARVAKKTGVGDVQPLSAATALTGPRLELIDMPHYRTGEVLVRVDTSRGRAWYVTDIILNLRELPAHLLIGLLFRITKSAPGLRYNNVGPRFMVKDLKALRRWLAEQYANAPPRWIIPAHGAVADLEADADGTRRLFSPP